MPDKYVEDASDIVTVSSADTLSLLRRAIRLTNRQVAGTVGQKWQLLQSGDGIVNNGA